MHHILTRGSHFEEVQTDMAHVTLHIEDPGWFFSRGIGIVFECDGFCRFASKIIFINTSELSIIQLLTEHS